MVLCVKNLSVSNLLYSVTVTVMISKLFGFSFGKEEAGLNNLKKIKKKPLFS